MCNSARRSRTLRLPRITVPSHLKEEKRGGNGDVEGRDVSAERNPDDAIAPLSHQPVETSTLAAEDEDDRRDEAALIVALASLGVRPDHPQSFPLEAFQCGDQVRDGSHGEIRRRSGGDAGHGRCETHRASPGDDHSMRARGLRGPDHRAEVVGIFDAVEGEQERSLVPLPRAREEVVQVHGRLGRPESRDALMRRAAAEAVEPPRIDDLHGNMAGPRLLNDVLKRTSVVGGPRDENTRDRVAGSEGLQDRAAAQKLGVARGPGRCQRTRHLNPVGVSSRRTPRSCRRARI